VTVLSPRKHSSFHWVQTLRPSQAFGIRAIEHPTLPPARERLEGSSPLGKVSRGFVWLTSTRFSSVGPPSFARGKRWLFRSLLRSVTACRAPLYTPKSPPASQQPYGHSRLAVLDREKEPKSAQFTTPESVAVHLGSIGAAAALPDTPNPTRESRLWIRMDNSLGRRRGRSPQCRPDIPPIAGAMAFRMNLSIDTKLAL
jgi:hypothetical protein